MRCGCVVCTMSELELDVDEWNELGEWRRLTILHK